MKTQTNQKKKSLFSMLNRFTLSIWLLLLLLCGIIVIYSCWAINKTIVESQQSILAVATNQLTMTLQSASNLLDEGVMDYVANGNEHAGENTMEKYLESNRIATFFEIKMQINPCVDCVFFTDDDSTLRLTRFQSRLYYTEKFAISDYLSNIDELENDAMTGNWHTAFIDEHYYLIQYYRIRSGGLGVVIGLDNLLNSVEAIRTGSYVQYCLTDNNGNVLTGTNTNMVLKNEGAETVNGNILWITAELTNAPLRISAGQKTNAILYGTNWIPILFILLGASSVILVGRYSTYLRRQFLSPVANLLQAINIVMNGNLDYEAPVTADTDELSILTTSFNYMTKEIKNQKIRAYEDEIQHQKMELKALRLQLRPHFYLNSINTILNLSRQGRNEEIQEFIMALSQYMRYLFEESTAQATVESEIAHTEDYIRLQQIRYPNEIFYMSDIEPAVRQVPMPRLVVQTFAENIFKHAFDGENMLSIFIRARLITENGEAFCSITVEDNGCGFDDVFLANTDRKESTGLRTIRKTMRLTYNREDLLKLYNTEQGGACVELRIPMAGDNRGKEK